MSPFGEFFEDRRKTLGIPRSTAARKLKIHHSYLTGIVHGKKSIPKNDFLERVSTLFRLSPEENEMLLLKAEVSKRICQIPDDASPDGYVLVHNLIANIKVLNHKHFDIMMRIMNF